MDLGIPTLMLKILLESNPLKSRILARRFAVQETLRPGHVYVCERPFQRRRTTQILVFSADNLLLAHCSVTALADSRSDWP